MNKQFKLYNDKNNQDSQKKVVKTTNTLINTPYLLYIIC